MPGPIQFFPTASMLLSPRVTLTSDPATSVQGINTYTLADGTLVYCIENGETFRLDRADSTTPPDGTTVIKPTAGPGRWKLFVAMVPPALPTKYYDASTGETTTLVTLPASEIIPRQNLGAELGFDVPAEPFARVLYVLVTGSVAEPFDGGGDFAWVWPVVTGNAVYSGDPVSIGVGGSDHPKAYAGEWRFPLADNEPGSVRFRWACRFGQGIGVFPNHATLPSRWQVSGLVMPA